MGLAVSLSTGLDCRAVGTQLLADIDGPFGSLQAIAAPASAEQLQQIGAGSADIDLGGVTRAVGALAEQALPLLAQLPAANDVFGPIGSAVDLFESAAGQDLSAQVTALLDKLRGELAAPPAGGRIALLLKLVDVLNGAGEGRVLRDLLQPLLDAGGIAIPALNRFTDPLAAAGGVVTLLGGMMSLETVLEEAQRLSTAMAGAIDAPALATALAALDQSLRGGPVSLAGFVGALAVDDVAGIGAARRAVGDVAAQLTVLPEQLNAAMGIAEATLVYLDIDRLQVEIDAAKAAIRGADLDPLGRVLAGAAGLLGPLLRIDPADLPPGQLSELIGRVEGEIAAIAASIAAIDTAGFVAPLADGIATVTSPLRELDRLIGDATTALRSALLSLRDAVAALPFQAIADAIKTFLQPITTVLDAIRALLDAIESALGAAAEAAGDAIGQIDGALASFKQAIDGFFGGVRDTVEGFDLDAVAGQIAQNIQGFADTLAQAQMKPYFDTAVGAIGSAADVVGAVPFGLLPESMKADVDAAVKPIKDVDVEAVEAQIEALLGIGSDGTFALRADLEAAIEELQAKYVALIAIVDDNDPRDLLADVDARLDEVAERVRTLAPDLTLEPVRDAIDQVKSLLQGIDLEAAIAPVQQVFTQIDATLDAYAPSKLVAPMQERIAALRAKIVEQIRLDDWSEALADLQKRAQDTLALASPERLRPPLEAAFGEALALLERFPDVDPSRALGSIVATLAGASGLRLSPTAFGALRAWLGGASGNAALGARGAAIATAIAATRRATLAVDLATAAPGVGAQVTALRIAVQGLVARLPEGDDRADFAALAPRLDLSIAFGGLDANRARLLALLDAAAARADGFGRTGFSEVDAGVVRFRAAAAPLAPAWRQLLALGAAIGLRPDEISVKGVAAAFLRALPPARLAALPMPVFDALRGRIDALLTAVLAPLQQAIADLRALLDAIDLAPLAEAADAVVADVKAQIDSLSPASLLAAPIASFATLRTAFVDNDPLAAVLEIVENLRDAVAALLEKLSLESLLETPLAIYDAIVADLKKLDPRGLLDPVFDQLDDIAKQVDEGLDETVAAFKRLQDALPAGGGGSTVSVNGTEVIA